MNGIYGWVLISFLTLYFILSLTYHSILFPLLLTCNYKMPSKRSWRRGKWQRVMVNMVSEMERMRTRWKRGFRIRRSLQFVRTYKSEHTDVHKFAIRMCKRSFDNSTHDQGSKWTYKKGKKERDFGRRFLMSPTIYVHSNFILVSFF